MFKSTTPRTKGVSNSSSSKASSANSNGKLNSNKKGLKRKDLGMMWSSFAAKPLKLKTAKTRPEIAASTSSSAAIPCTAPVPSTNVPPSAAVPAPCVVKSASRVAVLKPMPSSVPAFPKSNLQLRRSKRGRLAPASSAQPSGSPNEQVVPAPSNESQVCDDLKIVETSVPPPSSSPSATSSSDVMTSNKPNPVPTTQEAELPTPLLRDVSSSGSQDQLPMEDESPPPPPPVASPVSATLPPVAPETAPATETIVPPITVFETPTVVPETPTAVPAVVVEPGAALSAAAPATTLASAPVAVPVTAPLTESPAAPNLTPGPPPSEVAYARKKKVSALHTEYSVGLKESLFAFMNRSSSAAVGAAAAGDVRNTSSKACGLAKAQTESQHPKHTKLPSPISNGTRSAKRDAVMDTCKQSIAKSDVDMCKANTSDSDFVAVRSQEKPVHVGNQVNANNNTYSPPPPKKNSRITSQLVTPLPTLVPFPAIIGTYVASLTQTDNETSGGGSSASSILSNSRLRPQQREALQEVWASFHSLTKLLVEAETLARPSNDDRENNNDVLAGGVGVRHVRFAEHDLSVLAWAKHGEPGTEKQVEDLIDVLSKAIDLQHHVTKLATKQRLDLSAQIRMIDELVDSQSTLNVGGGGDSARSYMKKVFQSAFRTKTSTAADGGDASPCSTATDNPGSKSVLEDLLGDLLSSHLRYLLRRALNCEPLPRNSIPCDPINSERSALFGTQHSAAEGSTNGIANADVLVNNDAHVVQTKSDGDLENMIKANTLCDSSVEHVGQIEKQDSFDSIALVTQTDVDVNTAATAAGAEQQKHREEEELLLGVNGAVLTCDNVSIHTPAVAVGDENMCEHGEKEREDEGEDWNPDSQQEEAERTSESSYDDTSSQEYNEYGREPTRRFELVMDAGSKSFNTDDLASLVHRAMRCVQWLRPLAQQLIYNGVEELTVDDQVISLCGVHRLIDDQSDVYDMLHAFAISHEFLSNVFVGDSLFTLSHMIDADRMCWAKLRRYTSMVREYKCEELKPLVPLANLGRFTAQLEQMDTLAALACSAVQDKDKVEAKRSMTASVRKKRRKIGGGRGGAPSSRRLSMMVSISTRKERWGFPKVELCEEEQACEVGGWACTACGGGIDNGHSDWIACDSCLQRTHSKCIGSIGSSSEQPPAGGNIDGSAGGNVERLVPAAAVVPHKRPSTVSSSHTCARCRTTAETMLMGGSDAALVA